MDKYIFLVRHGETKLNKAVVFRGQLDVELNQNGLDQAKAVGERLRTLNNPPIYSSPLKRAVQTAEGIADHHNSKIEIQECLNDMNLGIWQGMPKSEVAEKFPDLWNQWLHTPENLQIPDGELLTGVSDRSFSGLTKLVLELKGNQMVVVTHRIICKLLILNIMGVGLKGFWKIHQDTCCLNLLRYNKNEGWSIVKINDTSHLDKGQFIFREDF